MTGGLSDQDVNSIVSMIYAYPDVVEARVFGSRAMGNYKAGSDIDIALFLETKEQQHRMKIVNELHDRLEEELVLPYFFDLLDYDSIENEALKEHIDRVGTVIYRK
jgi:predicted nucleotidyltransferase